MITLTFTNGAIAAYDLDTGWTCSDALTRSWAEYLTAVRPKAYYEPNTAWEDAKYVAKHLSGTIISPEPVYDASKVY